MAAEAAVVPEAQGAQARATPVAAPPVKPSKEQGAKAEKPKKAKPKKGAAVEEVAGDGPSVAAHPRAARSVAQAKGWGGLVGFLLGGYLSLSTGTVVEAGMRALVGGVVCYVAAWAGAVFLWRRLVMVELKAREQQLLAAARASQAAPVETAGARTV